MTTVRSRSGNRHKCVAFGCGNGPSDEHVSLHRFPLKNPALCRIWTNFVKTTRAKWAGPTTNSKLCSSHFTKECFPMRYSIMEAMGHPRINRRIVNRDAIPTIHCSKVLSTNKDPMRTDTQEKMYGSKSSTPKPRTAFIKRENARIIADYEKRRLTQMKTEKEEAENAAASQDKDHNKSTNEIKTERSGNGDICKNSSFKTQNSKPTSGLQFITTKSGLKIVMNCAAPIQNQAQIPSNNENKQLGTSMSSIPSTSSTQPKPAVIQNCKSPVHLIPVLPVAFVKMIPKSQNGKLDPGEVQKSSLVIQVKKEGSQNHSLIGEQSEDSQVNHQDSSVNNNKESNSNSTSGDIKDNMYNSTDTPRKDNTVVHIQPTPVGVVPSLASGLTVPYGKSPMLVYPISTSTGKISIGQKRKLDQGEKTIAFLKTQFKKEGDQSEKHFSYHQDSNNDNPTSGENFTGVVIKEEPPWDNVGETQFEWPSENLGMDSRISEHVSNTPTQCVYSSEENHEVPLEMSVSSIKKEPQDFDQDDSEMETELEYVTLQHRVTSHQKKDPKHRWKCVLLKEEPKD